MTDMPTDDRDQRDLRGIAADFDRTRAEILKFTAGQRRLTAEAAKLDRDRWLAPSVLLVSVSTGLAAAFGTAAISHLWK